MATASEPKRLDISTFKEISQGHGTKILAQVSGGVPHGLGVATKPNDESYKGFWKHGLFDGLGILKVGKEHTYCGNFEKGKPRGFGLLRKGNDLIFGEFDFDALTGSGSYSKPSMEYRGTFKAGIIEGFGRFTDKNSNIEYVGHFDKGNYGREGKLVSAHEKYIGFFANGKRTGAGHLIIYQTGEEYWGYWSHDKREAFGRSVQMDGRVYLGEWKQDKEHGIAFIEHKEKNYNYLGEISVGQRSGIGKFDFKNYTYMGQWKDSKKNGLGIESSDDGAIYFGFWVNNLKEGIGKEHGPNINYQGEWKGGKPHGKGILVTGKDSKIFVRFEDGKITKTLQQKELEGILKEIESLNYEVFKSEAEEKIKDFQIQLNSSSKQLEDRLSSVSPVLDSELVKFNSSMEEIEQKADAKVKAAKEIENLVEKMIDEFAKTGKSKLHMEVPETKNKEKSGNELKLKPETRKPKRSSSPKRGSVSSKKSYSPPNKMTPDETRRNSRERRPTNEKKLQEKQVVLEEQAERLAAYEKWLSKESQKIKASKSQKRMHAVNTEYSTKSMIDAEKEKVKKMFLKEFEKLTKDLDETKEELAKKTDSNTRLDAKNKQLEAYCNDVDTRNFHLKSSYENLLQESSNKYDEYTSTISELKARIEKLEKSNEAKHQTIETREGTIEELTTSNNHLGSELDKERSKFDDLQLKYIRAVVEIHAIRLSCEVYCQEKKEDLRQIDELRQQNSKMSSEIETLNKDAQATKDEHEKAWAAINEKHKSTLEELENERIKTQQENNEQIARLQKQIRILETGGEVDDTEDKLRQKELEESQDKMREAKNEIKKLKNTVELNDLEIDNLKKMVADRDKSLKETQHISYDLELKVNQLEETVRGFQIKQKEWTDIKEALANNIKVLKEREQELRTEIQSKKSMEREELNKRNDKLAKNFFDDCIKPRALIPLGNLRSSDSLYLLQVKPDGKSLYFGGMTLQSVANDGKHINKDNLKVIFSKP